MMLMRKKTPIDESLKNREKKKLDEEILESWFIGILKSLVGVVVD